MKRLVTLALSATLVCATPLVLAACGQKGESEEAATSETAQTDVSDAASTDEVAPFATLGDVFAADGENMSSTFDEQHYVCAFNYGGAWWRVEATLPNGMYDELNEVWVEDQAKVEELLSPLAVAKTDVLEPLDVESTEALAGKTGADLAADGFTFGFGTLVVNGGLRGDPRRLRLPRHLRRRRARREYRGCGGCRGRHDRELRKSSEHLVGRLGGLAQRLA